MQPISFAAFMQKALYDPKTGYYTQKDTPIGAHGDFITAPELTPLFGYTLARQAAEVFKQLATPILFEFGAGTGRLCIDMLTALEKEDILPQAYYILEVSAALKATQAQNIQQEIPHLAHLVTWHTTLPDEPFEGVIVANEVLDAMPVNRFLKTDQGLFESMISQKETGQYIETFEPVCNEALSKYVETYITHDKTPYTSEANLFIEPWLKSCFELLTKGVILLIDYGFPAHEYYHSDRHMGTLMCHYQHKAHTNPLAHPGQEDITAHVNFTHVADSALSTGFHVAGYTSQAAFLLALGLLNFLEETGQLKDKQAVKRLLQPHEMGELFKVMGLSKGFEHPMSGFLLHDKRTSLAP